MRRSVTISVALALLLPATAGLASEDPACPGVRPGAAMQPAGGGIETTWSFMLAGSDGGTYVLMDGDTLRQQATAGVNIYSERYEIEKTWKRGAGAAFADGKKRVSAHAVWFLDDTGHDVALLRLDRGVRWHSAVCGFGRPRAIDTSLDDTPVTVSIYGQQVDRAAKAGEDFLPHGRYHPVSVPKTLHVTSGNWGAPVLSGEERELALGFLASDGVTGGWRKDGENDPRASATGGTVYRLPPLMARAGRALGVTLTLARADTGVAR